MIFQHQKYIISQTIEQLQSQLSGKQFYRLKRQYLVNFDAIKEVEHYSSRKLGLHLTVPTEEVLTVGKEKITFSSITSIFKKNAAIISPEKFYKCRAGPETKAPKHCFKQ